MTTNWDDSKPLEDWEYPDPDDGDRDELDTIDCPECGREVYDEAPCCPECGYLIMADDRRGRAGIPLGWVGLLIVIGLLLIFVMFG